MPPATPTVDDAFHDAKNAARRIKQSTSRLSSISPALRGWRAFPISSSSITRRRRAAFRRIAFQPRAATRH